VKEWVSHHAPTKEENVRLTVRQAAVLAAIERRRECSLLDLRQDFPQLYPSTVLRVIDVLSASGLVNRVGDFERVYLGGVTFSPARLGGGSVDVSV
jgi:DNA-binding MarR family transcriptional regulator